MRLSSTTDLALSRPASVSLHGNDVSLRRPHTLHNTYVTSARIHTHTYARSRTHTPDTSGYTHTLMDGAGTVTWEEFLENAQQFLAVSDEISDGWKFHGNKDIPGQAYLVRKAKRFIPCNTAYSAARNDDTTGSDIEEFLKFQDDPHEAPSTDETPLITEHHILWSMSYGVPVLFFNGWKSDFSGINPVSVNEAQTVHSSQLNYMELSQAIHPVVGTPFLQLHPCLSRELLRSMSKSKNKLVSWLSCVAPAALNLRIHPEYYKLTC